MIEAPPVDVVEHAEATPQSEAPVLIVLPDPEASGDRARPVLGRPLTERLTHAALEAGFTSVLVTPGTQLVVDAAEDIGTGEDVGAPALVAFETAVLHPELLRLMVEHPLEPDERFSLYDGVGRPTAWFTGHLQAVPATMPMSEELDWPESLGPNDIARLVYADDRPRVERLILSAEKVFDPVASRWRGYVSLPTLRWLANGLRPLAQVELVALVLAISAGAVALIGEHEALVFAGVLLLAGIHASQMIPAARRLRRGPRSEADGGRDDVLCHATRPLAHAAMAAGTTYVLVSHAARTSVAGLVLLAAGGGAAFLSLLQARKLLRNQPADAFELPDAQAFAAHVGLRLPPALAGAPLLELAVLVAALPGIVELPWSLLVAAGVARLWRWFAGPTTPTPTADDGTQ